MDRMLFCRIGWMQYYQGKLEEDPIHGGGAFVDENGYGHEIYNFLPDDEGNLFGFVQVQGIGMSIWRLGANFDQNSVAGVTVVWCSSLAYDLYIVGWYNDATAFRYTQPCPAHLVGKRPLPKSDDHWTFRVATKYANAVLLPANERDFQIPIATPTSSGFGRQNIWYADTEADRQFQQKVQEYIQSKERGITISNDTRSKRIIHYQPDVEKRYEVEMAAMKAVTAYYQENGWVTQDVSDRNRGWDIEAKKDDSVLRIEVKGLSGETVLFDMTPREYEQMKLSVDGSYRVCVLTNALKDNRCLFHFIYSQESNDLVEETQNLRLRIDERTGARIAHVPLEQ